MLNVVKTRLASLETWREKSTNRRIFVAAVTVGGMTVLVKLVAMLKELLVANWFGTSDAIDAYLVAYIFAFFAVTVISESFHTALMPTFIQVREQNGSLAAKRLFAQAMGMVLALLLSFSVILMITAPYTLSILGSGFDGEKQALTQDLFYILIPVLTFRGLASSWAAILNADEQFAVVAFTPIFIPLLSLTFMFFGKSVYLLALGTVAGCMIETVLLGILLRKRDIPLLLSWPGLTPELHQVGVQYGSTMLSALLMSSAMLVDQAMAASLGSGKVASLNYGYRLPALVVGMGALTIGTAVLPHFSRQIAQERWSELRQTLKSYSILILSSTLVFTVVTMLLSTPITRLLYERGAFTSQDTHQVSQIQALYLVQVPFYLLSILVVRLISALQANQILVSAAILNICVNITLNLIFIRWLGVAGIALSTSLVYIISFTYLTFRLLKVIQKHYA